MGYAEESWLCRGELVAEESGLVRCVGWRGALVSGVWFLEGGVCFRRELVGEGSWLDK